MAHSSRTNSSLSGKKKKKFSLLSPFLGYIYSQSCDFAIAVTPQPGHFLLLLFLNCLNKTIINDSPFP